jgi:hypothetical protein
VPQNSKPEKACFVRKIKLFVKPVPFSFRQKLAPGAKIFAHTDTFSKKSQEIL